MLLDTLALKLLDGTFVEGDSINVDLDDTGTIVFRKNSLT
jgi:hypothetical protein